MKNWTLSISIIYMIMAFITVQSSCFVAKKITIHQMIQTLQSQKKSLNIVIKFILFIMVCLNQIS